jgi:hypothetical protein
MQQPGDELTYWAVDAILHGTNIDYYAMVPEESFGRWAHVLRELLLAHASGGRQAVLRRYLMIVYADPEFALLMASLGLRPVDKPIPEGALATRQRVRRRDKGQARIFTLEELLSGSFEQPAVHHWAGREDEVWEALRDLGEATVAQVAQHTGQDRSNVHRRLQRLCKTGEVVREETKRGIVYRLTQ